MPVAVLQQEEVDADVAAPPAPTVTVYVPAAKVTDLVYTTPPAPPPPPTEPPPPPPPPTTSISTVIAWLKVMEPLEVKVYATFVTLSTYAVASALDVGAVVKEGYIPAL